MWLWWYLLKCCEAENNLQTSYTVAWLLDQLSWQFYVNPIWVPGLIKMPCNYDLTNIISSIHSSPYFALYCKLRWGVHLYGLVLVCLFLYQTTHILVHMYCNVSLKFFQHDSFLICYLWAKDTQFCSWCMMCYKFS